MVTNIRVKGRSSPELSRRLSMHMKAESSTGTTPRASGAARYHETLSVLQIRGRGRAASNIVCVDMRGAGVGCDTGRE